MTKQEFMAMSLPYGLKVSTIKSVEYVKKFCLYDTRFFRLEFEISENSNDFRKSYPILRPLSDLTKEIKHKGEKLVPIIELAKIEGLFFIEISTEYYGVFAENKRISFLFRDGIFQKGRINYQEDAWIEDVQIEKQFDLFLKLIEWHFDIAGLIEKGEAIDINTLPENPYK